MSFFEANPVGHRPVGSAGYAMAPSREPETQAEFDERETAYYVSVHGDPEPWAEYREEQQDRRY